MKVRFKVNLGSTDAAKIDVDFRVCVVDAEVDVSDQAGKWLVANGIAAKVDVPEPPKPEPVPVVEPEPVAEVIPDPVPEPQEEQKVEESKPEPVTPKKKK